MDTIDTNEIKENISMHPTHKKIVVAIVIVSILVSSFFGALFGFMAGKIGGGTFFPMGNIASFFQKNQNNPTTSSSSATGQTTTFPDEESAVITAVDKSSPAVVSIIISKDVSKIQNFFSDPFGSDPFFDPFGSGQGQQGSGSDNSGGTGGSQKQEIGGGSGFIISADGMIVTNKHVVSDSTASYTVMTNDGKKYDAQVLALDPTNDVAIIKINATNLPVLSLGDSNNLKIGQTVIAIGNSLGEFRNTVSKGIVSGLKRNVTAGSGLGDSETLSEVVQTDAAINPGNSGGPLLNINGQVIGVNVAMAEGAQNVGFALPIDVIKKDIDSVKAKGKIVQPFLGVRYMPVTADIAQQNNIPYNYGVLVVRGQQVTDFAVVPGSPADKAGIVENDIILEVNGTKIDDTHQLADLVSKYNVGDTITLKIWHKGVEKTVQVTLEERK